MISLTTVISTKLGSATKRLVKILRLGKSDVQEPVEAGPYGVDSNPIKNMVAVYAATGMKGKTVIIGYLNKNQKAGVGEMRTYATDADGEEKFYIWQKADGTCEIGGDGNFAVKFNELKTEFNKLKADHNALLAEYKLHTHTGVTVGMGVTGTTVSTQNANTSDIDQAKNDKIKTI